MDVAQAHGADGGSATEHGGGHGTHVQDRAEVAPGHQVVLVGFRAPHAIPAKPEHAGGVDHYNNDVQGHWGSPDYLYYGEIDHAGGFTAPGGLVVLLAGLNGPPIWLLPGCSKYRGRFL
ncbi:hypothetical protein D3C78_1324180 [compost metagenome]